ncbi:MAG: glutamine amidotransferase [Tepidisphaeraceae bacterium]
MTEKPILYLGDLSLATAAGYLAGLMTMWDVGYDYLPTDVTVNGEASQPRNLFVISDYPAKRMPLDIQQTIARKVEAGAGLIMIGGWESFHGFGGDWDNTVIGNILPVEIDHTDDRINCDQPTLVRCLDKSHPIVQGLPWDERPPMIGGFNRFAPKPDAEVLLDVQRFDAQRKNGQMAFRPLDELPLLVVGRHGRGRVAALATDIAPHWVGGLVDWGSGPRIITEAPGSWAIEVGTYYAKFLHNLLNWAGRLDESKPARKPLVATT